MDMKVTNSANYSSPMLDKHNYSEIRGNFTDNNIHTRSWKNYIQVKCRQRRLPVTLTTEQKTFFINKLLSDNIQSTRLFVTINQIVAVLADQEFALSSVIGMSS
jgi:hypothetical protein